MRSFSPTLKATLTLLGTMMGAGLFALPATFVRVGWRTGSISFFLVTLLVLVTHLLYAEVFLANSVRHRLPGLVKKELGPKAFALAAISHPFHLMGAHVVYLMLGAGFLQQLVGFIGFSLPILFAMTLFFVVNVVCVQYGWRAVAKVESAATWLLIGGMIVTIGILMNTRVLVPSPSISLFLAWQPFGIFLFALSGFPVIGEVVQIAKTERRRVHIAVVLGTLGAAFLSWLFALAFSGSMTDRTGAIGALLAALPTRSAWILPIVGILAIITSYITTGTELVEGFQGDYRWSRAKALTFALVPAFFAAIFLGQRVLLVTGLVGTVFCGLNGIFIALIASQIFKRSKMLRPWRGFAFVTALVYTSAIFIHFSAWLR